MQISRLFEIVYLLMNKKNCTAKELSEHFEVSQRTIYRDIDTLCQSGVPIYTVKGKGGGIALMDNFIINKSVLSKQEQDEILAALSGFQAASNSEASQALKKLNALFGNQRSDWIEVDFSNWSRNEEDKQKFHLLKEAILSCHVIHFRYFNSYGQESERSLEPYKLAFRGQGWYLYGFCRTKKEFRYFKTTRIKELTIETETFPFNQAYAAQKELPPYVPSKPPMIVELQIDAEMGYRVYDEFPQEAITKNNDGSFLIHTSLQQGGWLTGYLMSYEDHITILSPPDLRDSMIQKHKKALEKYKF